MDGRGVVRWVLCGCVVAMFQAGCTPAEDSVQVVRGLEAGVQVSTYVDRLGGPLAKRPVPGGEFVEWVWRRPEFVVQAVVDHAGQVDIYTVTSTDPTFDAPIPYTDGLRLGRSNFADLRFDLVSGVYTGYPASAKYEYSEEVGPAGATHGRTLILTKSWDGTGTPRPADDAIDLLARNDLSCGRPDDTAGRPCEAVPERDRLRAGLRISGFTLTARDFDPSPVPVNRSPWLQDSACDIPGECR
ncbi:hypothetical protein GCM10023321_22460 [Pseudonocardia eucalypti]|uniref:Lipoprotein n=2 Tax=Pseudonocardia eucalypti TaxID=648755 RepID=A0ABP9PVM0_9PSEU